MKTRKYFDIHSSKPKMPENIVQYFFKERYDTYLCNDMWVLHPMGLSKENLGKHDILDQWLLDNCDVEENEEIFISHSW